jgi:hypothetical protein
MRLLPALLLLLITTSLSAATYYVAPNGRDRNRGSLQAPFATISRGVDALKAGDELLVRGGTYNEAVSIQEKRGTTAAPIRIQAYPNEKPVIEGKGTRANAVVIISLCSNLRFDGFEVRNGPKSGIILYDVHHVKLRGNDVHDHFRFGIHVASASASRRGATHDVVLEGNKVHHNVQQNANGNAREWMQGIGTWRASTVEITDNDVYENFGEGIDAVVSDRVSILGNTVWDNFSANIYLDNATNPRVDGNFVVTGWAADPSRYFRGGHPAPSIFTANEDYDEQTPLTGLTITNNITVGGKYGFGYGNFQHGGGLHHSVIANNTFYGATDRVLYIENGPGEKNIHDSTTIENNIFFTDGDRVSAYAPSQTITYRSNCWYGGRARSQKWSASDLYADPRLANPGGKDKTDYRLTAASPCVDKGTQSPARQDLWGTPRPRGWGWDIGAHELPSPAS